MDNSSILNTIKKMLGVDADYDAFDMDIIVNINSSFFTLFQLGVGPLDEPFIITGIDETWSEFTGDDPGFESVKTYVYLKVKIVFDPPTSSFVLDALKKQTEELEWRLLAQTQR